MVHMMHGFLHLFPLLDKAFLHIFSFVCASLLIGINYLYFPEKFVSWETVCKIGLVTFDKVLNCNFLQFINLFLYC